ncbi:MAG: hypothetical protein AAF743_15025 [Planctomycetota bacterium]
MSYRQRKTKFNRQQSETIRYLHAEKQLPKLFILTATRLSEDELDDILDGGTLKHELEQHIIETLCGAVDLTSGEVLYETARRDAKPVKPEHAEVSALIMNFLRTGAEHDKRLRLERRARDAG